MPSANRSEPERASDADRTSDVAADEGRGEHPVSLRLGGLSLRLASRARRLASAHPGTARTAANQT